MVGHFVYYGTAEQPWLKVCQNIHISTLGFIISFLAGLVGMGTALITLILGIDADNVAAIVLLVVWMLITLVVAFWEDKNGL